MSCSTTVDIERPRDGGAAISCSQIASKHFSESTVPVGGTGAWAPAWPDCSVADVFAAVVAEGFSAVAASIFFDVGASDGDVFGAVARGALDAAVGFDGLSISFPAVSAAFASAARDKPPVAELLSGPLDSE